MTWNAVPEQWWSLKLPAFNDISNSEDREEWLARLARLANHDLHLPFLQLDGLRAVLLILLQVCY